jgi:hypothetical protein
MVAEQKNQERKTKWIVPSGWGRRRGDRPHPKLCRGV